MPSITMSPEQVSAYIAQAGRDAWKVPGLPSDAPLREIRSVGVIGAGTMGGGISMNFATAGIPVRILETKQEALDRGLSVVRGHYQRSADKGRFPQEDHCQCHQAAGGRDRPTLLLAGQCDETTGNRSRRPHGG